MSPSPRSRSPPISASARTLSSSRPREPRSQDEERDGLDQAKVDASAEDRGERLGHGRKVYWSFWLLGAAILLSWNVLIISLPTLSTYFPPTSPLRKELTSIIATVFTFGNFGALGGAQVGIAKANQVKRTRLALLVLLLTFLVTSLVMLPLLLPHLSKILNPTSKTYQTLLLLLLLLPTLSFSFATSLLQSSVIAIASLWGSREVLAVMSGQGGVAVLVSGVGLYLSVVGALSGEKVIGIPEMDDSAAKMEERSTGIAADAASGIGPTRAESISTIGLWMIASIGVLACFLLTRTVLDERNVRERMARSGGRSSLSAGNGKVHDANREDRTISQDAERQGLLLSGESGQEVDELIGPAPEQEEFDARTGSSVEVFWKNAWLNFAVFYVFVVTLALFPPVTTTILSVHKPWPKLLQPGVFIPLHFFIFNASDFFGRTYMPTLPGFLITNPKHVALLSFSRTLFVPLFLSCNTVFGAGTSDRMPWINSDVAYMSIVAAFGATTGYVTSLSMILASSPTLNPNINEEEKHIAGTVAGFSLCAGLAAGSLASFGVKGIMGLGS